MIGGAPDSQARVTVRALGGFRVMSGARELKFRTRKEALLFLKLALAAPGWTTRDACIELLWARSGPSRGRHSLSEALRGITMTTSLLVTRNGDRLAVENQTVVTDLHRLQDAIEASDVERTSQLYTGPFLAGWHPPTIESSHWVDFVGAKVLSRAEVMARRQLQLAREATNISAVRAAIKLLSRLGRATDADRKGATEIERLGLEQNSAATLDGPFVGRAKEMQALTKELDKAFRGQMRVATVSGEGGIGKTRICQRLASLAALRGARLFLGGCYQLEQAVAFGAIGDALVDSTTTADLENLNPAFRQILQEVLPGRVTTGTHVMDRPPLAGSYSALRALCEFFEGASRHQTSLLFLDDVHWADASSCQALHYIFRRARPATGALIVLSFRSDGIENNSSAHLLVKTAVESGLNIHLPPMSNAEILAQIARICPGMSGGEASDLAIIARGNPYFARELARAGAASFASGASRPTLEDVVVGRVNQLPKHERNILDLLAVAEAPLPISVAARVRRESISATLGLVSSLEARGFTKLEGDCATIDHELLRRAVYSAMNRASRQVLHGELARALPGALPGVIATHYSKGEQHVEAYHYAKAAAAQSHSQKAFLEEVGWLELALHHARGSHVKSSIKALIPRLFSMARYSEAVDVLQRYTDHLDDRLRAQLALARLKGTAVSSTSYPEMLSAAMSLYVRCRALAMGMEGIEALRERIRYAQEQGDLEAVFSTVYTLEEFAAMAAPQEAAYATAVVLLKLATFEPEKVRRGIDYLQSNPTVLPDARTSLAIGFADVVDLYNHGQAVNAGINAHKLIRTARACGEIADEVRVRALLVPLSSDVMRFPAAERHARFVFDYSRLADTSWECSVTLTNLAAVRLEAGDFRGAHVTALKALKAEHARTMWILRAYSQAVLGTVALKQGRLAEAQEHASAIESDLPPIKEWVTDLSLVAVFLSSVWIKRGSRQMAIAMLQELAAHSRTRYRVCYWTVRLELARLGEACEMDTPRQIAANVKHEAEQSGCRLLAARAEKFLVDNP